MNGPLNHWLTRFVQNVDWFSKETLLCVARRHTTVLLWFWSELFSSAKLSKKQLIFCIKSKSLNFNYFRIRIRMRMSFIGQVCLHIRGICCSDRSSTVQQNDSNRTGPEHVSGAERWEFPLPAHVDVRSPAPPLKVTADRSAQFRSPLTYNFIPLRWNRSALVHILNSSACLTPAVFNRSLGTHCLRDGRGAGLLRNCCRKIRFTSILSPRGRGCSVVRPRTWYTHIPQAVWLL